MQQKPIPFTSSFPSLATALALTCGAALVTTPCAFAAQLPAATQTKAPATPRIASIAIPGHAPFVAIAREVLLIQTTVTPDFASQSGLIDDAIRVPSFTPERIQALTKRLHTAMSALRALPWREWNVDEQIDVRWVYTNAERLDRELNVERLQTHRPGAWLETLANNYIAILTYAPNRDDALDALTRGIPGVVAEMRALCVPTQVDTEVALGLIGGIESMLKGRSNAGSDSTKAALAALAAYRHTLASTTAAQLPFSVIGAQNYAWRLQHASMLPWTPQALLALAERKLSMVDSQMAALAPKLQPKGDLPAELKQAAASLTQASLLALYDDIQTRNRAAIETAGFVTIPAGVGPVRARVTPDAMVPLTGDGGSMNPPPPFVADNTGWWNVEHFKADMPLAERELLVRQSAQFQLSSMGPYSVHEGLPGHHLQLAIARLNPDPLRNLYQDPVQNEGWALYAEQVMWEQGGMGALPDGEYYTLRSWRHRIRRVVYDVKIETGVWTLQQGADWKAQKPAGQTPVDEDVKRSVNWPAQLICYFAGKEQILELKADYKKKLGSAYTERRFHDELLALGSVPYVFARAKMLGEPVPGF